MGGGLLLVYILTPAWWTLAESTLRLFEPVKIDNGPQIKTKSALTIGRGDVPVMVNGVHSVQQSTQYFVWFMDSGGKRCTGYLERKGGFPTILT